MSRPPLDAEALERSALHYVGRYASTRAKLAAFLRRKLRERGWEGIGEPPVDALIERMARLGYVDDRAFATARAASLGRRGYGERRVGEAIRAAGVDAADGQEAQEMARDNAWSAALRFAERRRIGPFAAAEAARPEREKAIAAMLRAGHPLDLSRRIATARPGEIPEADSD
ncbi:MAG TPA: RecX family transcriptional regulator [Allosphingosinicella sp.]|nr:RecX family transcriptional regulator [Allosphingosinicella sp.]